EDLHVLASRVAGVASVGITQKASLDGAQIASRVHPCRLGDRVHDVAEICGLIRLAIGVKAVSGPAGRKFDWGPSAARGSTSRSQRHILGLTFECAGLEPLQFGRPMIDVILIEGVHIPRIPAGTLDPEKRALGSVPSLNLRIDRSVYRIGVAWP